MRIEIQPISSRDFLRVENGLKLSQSRRRTPFRPLANEGFLHYCGQLITAGQLEARRRVGHGSENERQEWQDHHPQPRIQRGVGE
jgi:hypothetical protein